MDTFDEDRPGGVLEAPLTLAEPPPRPLGIASITAFWWNLGISLLLPVAAVYVVLPNRPLWVSLLAIVVGALIGGTLLGLAADPGVETRVGSSMQRGSSYQWAERVAEGHRPLEPDRVMPA